MKLTPFAVPAVLALAACRGDANPVVCSLPFMPMSVSVTVQDSVSEANVTPGATVELRNAAYVDSAVGLPEFLQVGVGYNVPGTFTLTVRQTGYQAWTKWVTVEGDGCYVHTLPVVARMKPA